MCGEGRERKVELFSHSQILILTNYLLPSNKKVGDEGRMEWRRKSMRRRKKEEDMECAEVELKPKICMSSLLTSMVSSIVGY